ncbi:uncharacterized protein N7496_010628 [Penicillium cataractarum]|uniref:DUF2264 domain-containing protein n=1 Tax=Penicillium cataractarum TaxID=2100454 RepID=A0A9W9V3A4_9EURO|nr:uncharacterized protein N7496_010628 [Penicillium cataractarum]KAJ5364915.1 hypothetical protein N7496_010628 [Penicillium cataractarum]
MPALPGFTDNPFQTRDDLVRASIALIKPLERYRSPQRAFIKLSTDTAAGFDEVAAQLEGFARPLWAIASLLAPGNSADGLDLDIDSWVCGLRAGTTPACSEYWGDLGNSDQRMVEMESISYALLMAPEAFLSGMDALSRENLETWLRQINARQIPRNNWRWFRVLVNLALGSQEEDIVAHDLNVLDSFDLGEGWSSDGLWGDERKQVDYYSGSFAIQFARMLYVRFMEDRGLASHDRNRVERYKQEARQFASAFWRYFDVDGSAIPFGRSLTYRFAFAAFWSAVALAGVQLDAPLDNIGVVKGLLFRHLRWWRKHPGIFNTDGTMNIGYAYPNMFLSENYNSPQSVYWCLKSFTIICLPKTHHFWTAKELRHPLAVQILPALQLLDEVKLLWPPRHIICNGRSHHFLLSAGQGTTKAHRAREAKYGKMAYSSFFGFSVPSGPLLEQLASDSTLTVSLDGGEQWIVRANPFDVRHRQIPIIASDGTAKIDEVTRSVPSLVSTWRPKKAIEFQVQTILIPASDLWSGWHFRIHRVKWSPAAIVPGIIKLVDAGFAASGSTKTGILVAEKELKRLLDQNSAGMEGWGKDEQSCLILSDCSASGVVDLQRELMSAPCSGYGKLATEKAALVVRADANTNLITQRTLVPAIQNTLVAETGLKTTAEVWLATGIFAVSKTSGIGMKEVQKLWFKRPTIHVAAKTEEEEGVRIMLP